MHSEWFQYEAEGDDYVPMDRWGKDHWSTLAYLETCTVDHKGMVDNSRMRCNIRLHRDFAFDRGFGPNDGSMYPTILKDGTLDHHDDWSCLEDMVAAGLITAEFKTRLNGKIIGGGKARIKMTKLGLTIVTQIREHKMSGGSFSEFELDKSSLPPTN